VLMQTVCIDGSIIEPRYISTDGQDHESGADEEESSADQRPSTQSLLGPVDVTLELCCNVHAPCYLDLEYRPLYSPGAHLSRIMMTSHSNAESAEAKRARICEHACELSLAAYRPVWGLRNVRMAIYS